MKCFFCDVQKQDDSQRIAENDLFFSRFDDFPISPGHAEIIPKQHQESFFELTADDLASLYELLLETKAVIESEFHPQGYNLGLNEGAVAGQTINHWHLHIIPRYLGDVENPRGGVRNIISGKGDYPNILRP